MYLQKHTLFCQYDVLMWQQLKLPEKFLLVRIAQGGETATKTPRHDGLDLNMDVILRRVNSVESAPKPRTPLQLGLSQVENPQEELLH